MSVNGGNATVPTVVLPDGTALTNPPLPDSAISRPGGLTTRSGTFARTSRTGARKGFTMSAVNGGDLHHPAVDAALATAAGLVGMEVVFICRPDRRRVRLRAGPRRSCPASRKGVRLPRADSFCHRMLAGAPSATADAAQRPGVRRCARTRRVRHHVLRRGARPRPRRRRRRDAVRRRPRQRRRSREDVDPGARRARGSGQRTRQRRRPAPSYAARQPAGTSARDTEDDLLTAMVLADLLAGEIAPPGRPPRSERGRRTRSSGCGSRSPSSSTPSPRE